MNKMSNLLYPVEVIQIILGIFYLFFPEFFLKSAGHSIPQADTYHPLAMLAARFIAYGLALIQLIDLGAGIFYTLSGVVNIANSAFPVFNATWIIVLLLLWTPKKSQYT